MACHPNLGLDELMIVNPGGAPAGRLFVTPDGRLFGLEAAPSAAEPAGGGEPGFFLADDGTLYEVQTEATLSGAAVRSAGEAGGPRYFLGDDGTVYEVVS